MAHPYKTHENSLLGVLVSLFINFPVIQLCAYCTMGIFDTYAHAVLQVLVKKPCECTTGIIERVLQSRDDNAQGVGECVIDSRDRKPSLIITVVYERERCCNWFVARFSVNCRAPSKFLIYL